MSFREATFHALTLYGYMSEQAVFIPYAMQEIAVLVYAKFASLAYYSARRNANHLGYLLGLCVWEITLKYRKHIARPIDALAQSAMLHRSTLFHIIEHPIGLFTVSRIPIVLLLALTLLASTTILAVLALIEIA